MTPGAGLANPERDLWPESYQRARGEVREAYAYATRHADLLSFMPCYCGCVQDGHRGNYDCYVQEVCANGWLVLDPHGFG